MINGDDFKKEMEFFQSSDHISDCIRLCETALTKQKLYIPFKVCIQEDNLIKSYISWELIDEISKKYRLFLIIEEIKEDDPTNKQVFRKPFIETNISLRFKLGIYIPLFINSFKEYLEETNKKLFQIIQELEL